MFPVLPGIPFFLFFFCFAWKKKEENLGKSCWMRTALTDRVATAKTTTTTAAIRSNTYTDANTTKSATANTSTTTTTDSDTTDAAIP